MYVYICFKGLMYFIFTIIKKDFSNILPYLTNKGNLVSMY